jgi:type VI secretion system secreted protein VgrG
MPDYTQSQRPFKIDTVLGEDVLLLERLSGEEGVSSPFHYTLDLLSQDDSIPADALLRTEATLTIKLPNGGDRTVHGLIKTFVQLGQTENGELTAYQAEIVPWLWFLSLSTDCKIFQNLNVLEIVEQVFKGQGYVDYEVSCVRSYAPREYCVQYRETHLNFVSRLLEEEGIYYFFQHTSSGHVLTLADDPIAVKPCPGQAGARLAPQAERWQEEDVVTAFRREHRAYVGRVTLRDYDPLQPSLQLESSVAGDGVEEVYDYPARYTQLDDGTRLARLRLEEREAWQDVVTGESTCRSLQSGFSIDISGHYRKDFNQTYQLLEVRHSAQAGDYRTWDSAPCRYRNSFTAVPSSVPFRPPARASKPVVRGSQTAVVVGKSGEEIWVDSHGRVKVQFYWDRDGKRDENSSCWVRVASTWAGKSWGLVSIPRIGQEVVVDFLEGDPDRPIITGQVYNAEMVPPFGGPGSQTQSGIRSRSSKGGSAGNYSEIRMDDSTGGELLFIRAEKDKQVVVNNDRKESVGHDEAVQISNDRNETVGNNESISVGNDQSVTVGSNRSESVGVDQSLTVGSNRSKMVGSSETATISANQRVRIGGSRTKGIGGNEAVSVGSSRRSSIGRLEQMTVGMSRMVAVGLLDALTVGLDLQMMAGRQAAIRVGMSSITLNADGSVKIKGKNIQIEGDENIEINGTSTVALKAETITQN